LRRALLDINVLLALLDSDHVDHRHARRWIETDIGQGGGWASCAITQNGFVRIISQPRYPSPITPAEAIALLARATASELHAYWPCSPSLLAAGVIDRTRLHGHGQVTDAYLLALATINDGRFVTFDRSISVTVAVGATDDNMVVL